jgi:hypothetical protein
MYDPQLEMVAVRRNTTNPSSATFSMQLTRPCMRQPSAGSSATCAITALTFRSVCGARRRSPPVCHLPASIAGHTQPGNVFVQLAFHFRVQVRSMLVRSTSARFYALSASTGRSPPTRGNLGDGIFETYQKRNTGSTPVRVAVVDGPSHVSPKRPVDEHDCIGARLIVVAQCRHAILNDLLWRCFDRRQQQLLKKVLALRCHSILGKYSESSNRVCLTPLGMCNSRCTRCQASGIRCCPANGAVANSTAPSMRSLCSWAVNAEWEGL